MNVILLVSCGHVNNYVHTCTCTLLTPSGLTGTSELLGYLTRRSPFSIRELTVPTLSSIWDTQYDACTYVRGYYN